MSQSLVCKGDVDVRKPKGWSDIEGTDVLNSRLSGTGAECRESFVLAPGRLDCSLPALLSLHIGASCLDPRHISHLKPACYWRLPISRVLRWASPTFSNIFLQHPGLLLPASTPYSFIIIQGWAHLPRKSSHPLTELRRSYALTLIVRLWEIYFTFIP